MRFAIAVCLFVSMGLCVSVHADHHEEGFYALFDGKTLDGWDGNPKFWSVQDGAITGITTKENPTKGNTFVIWRGGNVDDFELRLKFKITGGNSGVQYRSEDKGNWVAGGYQADFESGDTYSGILYEEKGRGILAQRGQVTKVVSDGEKHKVEVIANIGESSDINKAINKEDWNDYKIIAAGNQMMHIINNRMTVQVIDEDKKHAAASGILALQLHAGPPMKVQFKDIRIKPLKGFEVDGKWNFQVTTANGVGEPTFTFEKKNGKLMGNYSGAFGDSKIRGTVKGRKLSWNVSGMLNGQAVTSDYEGEFSGPGKMKGIVIFNEQFEAEWTATRVK